MHKSNLTIIVSVLEVSAIFYGCSGARRSGTSQDAQVQSKIAPVPEATPTAPAAPTTLALASPATSPGNIATPIIDVAGVLAGATVELFTDDHCTTSVGSGVATDTSLKVTTAKLADGVYKLFARQTVGSGLSSPCSQASVNYTLITVPPESLEITGLPSGSSGLQSLTAQVAGQGLAAYRFALLDAPSGDCAGAAFGDWLPIDEPLKIEDLGADGGKTLCVMGRDAAGNAQVVANAFSWTKVYRVSLEIAHGMRLTDSAPLISASANPADSTYFLIGFWGGWWSIETFVLNGSVYIAAPSKYGDSGGQGWNMSLAKWDPTTPNAAWIDGDPGTAGVNQYVSKFATANDAVANNDFKNMNLVANPDGKLFGIGQFRAGINVPIVANSLSTLAISSFDTSHLNLYSSPFSANDGSWHGGYPAGLDLDLLYDKGTVYIYQTSQDAPTNSQFYLSIASTQDMVTVTEPTSYVATGFRYPSVDAFRGTYHMIALNTATSHWEYIQGQSPTSWDFAHATDLGLRNLRGTGAAWDAVLFDANSEHEPQIVGMHVLADDSPAGASMYIFYMAGADTYTAGTAPYGASRSIGVFKLPFQLLP